MFSTEAYGFWIIVMLPKLPWNSIVKSKELSKKGTLHALLIFIELHANIGQYLLYAVVNISNIALKQTRTRYGLPV